jgi:hypothetical protein
MADAEHQLAVEGAQRRMVGALAVLSGVLLFAGELWAAVVEAKTPTVGLFQGLRPALHGLAAAAVDPRTAQERFLVHHQVPLIASLVISAVGWVAMTFPLRYMAAAERLRSPQPQALTGYLAQFAPWLVALFVPALEISLIVGAHSYLGGAARTASAVTAASGGGLRVALQLIATIGQLGVAAGFVLIAMRSMRVGLITRLMGTFGIIGGVLFLIPLTPLPVIQALWLVFLGAMLLGFGNRPLPEAWSVAEARPWPPREPARRGAERPARPTRGSARAAAKAPPPPAPEPALPSGPNPNASKKRKRRR